MARRLFNFSHHKCGAYLKIVPVKFAFSIFLFNGTLSIFLSFSYGLILTDGKSRIMREIHAVITRTKISAVRANSFVVVEQFSVFPGYTEFLE